jgi:hypothetical protein
MDFALSDEQKMMIDTVRRFIAEELHPLEDRAWRTAAAACATRRWPSTRRRKSLGLYAMNMPAELGGGGLSAVDRILCEEQFGHTSDYPDPPRLRQRLRAAAAVQGRAGGPLAGAGGARRAHLRHRHHRARRRLGRRGHPTHPSARGPSGWVLNGAKHFISDGEWSDFFLVSAKTGEKEIDVHGGQGPARLHRGQGPEDDGHPRHAPCGALLRQRGAGAAGPAGRTGPGLQAGDGRAQRGAPGPGRRARCGQGQPRLRADDRLRQRPQAIQHRRSATSRWCSSRCWPTA